jgi:nucleotide-binding universal stress UspA family protein
MARRPDGHTVGVLDNESEDPMFTNVFVGVDGRQGGRDAIALAAKLASPGATITLVHVHGSDWLLPRGAELASLAAEQSQRLLSSERETAGIDAQLMSGPQASPGRGLHEMADRDHADLLVVGSSRHALLGRALVGDDTRAALNGAPCAVAVAPRGYAQTCDGFRAIGVGYDGSPQARVALNAARTLAGRDGAEVKALWVVSLEDVRDDCPLPAYWQQATDTLIERHRKELERLDDIDGDATYGGPREELSRFSKEVDLLIIGSRNYGPIYRVFHGTTSTYLARHLACPLVQLPRLAGAVADPSSRQPESAAVPAA